MGADFAKSFAVWLVCEGSEPAGIEQTTYDEYRRRHSLPPQPVAKITDAETQGLLREFYWQPYRLGGLPQPWATFCLVEASNLPSGAGVKIAQASLAWLGVYDGQVDGDVGPLTIEAAGKAPTRQDVAITAALGHYAVSSPENIQRGLRRRLAVLRQACLEQAQ
jgi:lysozyme family protein